MYIIKITDKLILYYDYNKKKMYGGETIQLKYNNKYISFNN